MSSKPTRWTGLTSVVTALLIITAGLAGGPATVSATHDCNGAEMTVATFAAGFDGIYNMATDGMSGAVDVITGDAVGDTPYFDKCGRTHSSGAVEEMKSLDAEQEWLDFYQAYAAAQENQRQGYVESSNNLEESDTVAWTRMQFDANQAYKDGDLTLAEYKQAGFDTARDYYGHKQALTLETAETHMADVNYQIQRADSEDQINASDTLNVGTVTDDGTIVENESIDNVSHTTGMTNVTYRLASGEQYMIEVLTVTDTDTDDDIILSPVDPKYVVEPDSYDGDFAVQYRDSWTPADGNTAGNWTSNDQGTALIAVAPDGSGEDNVVAYDPSLYNHEFYLMSTIRDQLEDNFDGFAEQMYEAFEDGTVTPDEATPATGYIDATDPSNAENHYIYKIATLSSMGFETPDLNQTGTMTMAYDGSEYTGLLVSENTPEDGWVVGTEYNPADIDGREIFVTTDGNMIDIENGTSFTITSATDKDGNDIDTVETDRTVEKTYNNDDYLELVDRINDMADEIEDREPEGTGVGPSGSGIAWWQGGLMALALLAALYVLSMRGDDEPPYGGSR